MKITFIGTIKKPQQNLLNKALNAPPMTVASLLDLLEYPKEHRAFIVALHQGRRMAHTETITEEMDIELTVTVGGG